MFVLNLNNTLDGLHLPKTCLIMLLRKTFSNVKYIPGKCMNKML